MRDCKRICYILTGKCVTCKIFMSKVQVKHSNTIEFCEKMYDKSLLLLEYLKQFKICFEMKRSSLFLTYRVDLAGAAKLPRPPRPNDPALPFFKNRSALAPK